MTQLAEKPSESLSTDPSSDAASDAISGATADAIRATVAGARAAFESGRTRPYEWRVTQLKQLRRMLVDNEVAWAAALRADLGRSATEAWLTEVGFVVNEITHTLRHLRGWLRPKRAGVPLWLQPAAAKIVRDPLGVVLNIAPWNYPVQLTLAPVVGAIAAGNAVVIKPSEVAPATSRLIAELVPQYLDQEAVRVVEGGVPETTTLLAERFDHIFYTGNGTVARVVAAAAARHLTPTTLELGGKSPTFVDEGADLRTAARRIAWGKFLNAGQTCVAPDYVIATRRVLDELKPLLVEAIRELHGDQPKESPNYGRIVADRHVDRLVAMIDPAKVVHGGEVDRESRYIAPTILDGVTPDDAVMGDEIFGPILPFVEVSGVDEAISFITGRDKPLALYVFTRNGETRRRFTTETSSGGLVINAGLVHLGAPDLPFGGVGPSGSGAYHGEKSIEIFSHGKSVLRLPTTPDLVSFIYPPFTGLKKTVIRRIIAPAKK